MCGTNVGTAHIPEIKGKFSKICIKVIKILRNYLEYQQTLQMLECFHFSLGLGEQ